MEDKIIEILESLGYPVYEQGSMTQEDGYPESFYTFCNNGTEGAGYYDNHAAHEVYDYDINFYTSNPEIKSKGLLEAANELKAAGWSVPRYDYRTESDEPTHTGRGMNIIYLGGM